MTGKKKRQPTPEDKARGNRIRVAREKKGWNQPQLALNMGVTKQRVTQWESGDTITPRNLRTMASLLDTTEEWLEHEIGSGELPLVRTVDVFVTGTIEDGVEAQALRWPKRDWGKVRVAIEDTTIDADKLHGRRVIGRSMEAVFPEGTIIICADYNQEPLVSKRRYVIAEMNPASGSHMAVREARLGGNGRWYFCARPLDPSLGFPDMENDADKVTILYRVVTAQVPQP